MLYAAVLCFDREAATRIEGMMHTAAAHTGNSYLLDIAMPPHITVASFESDSDDDILRATDACVAGLSRGCITWTSVGSFCPRVLYVAPILDAYLRHACEHVNRVMRDFPVGDGGHYLPDHWVPHTTVATRLDHAQLVAAFEAVTRDFTPLSGVAQTLCIARCNPFTTLKTYALT